MINLSVNNLDDESKDSIEKFMNQANDKFTLILTNNKFSDKFKEKFKKKLNKRIHLWYNIFLNIYNKIKYK